MSEHHQVHTNGPVPNGTHPEATATGTPTSDSPPAFLDLADSAARMSSNLPDINARIEQKRIEHERLRTAHRRMFEEQMRALEEQQLAEERALAAANNGSPSAPSFPGNSGNGTNSNSATVANNNGALGYGMVALSAPTTPPAGGAAMLLSPLGEQSASYTTANGLPGVTGLPSAGTPTSQSPIVGLDTTTATFSSGVPGVIGGNNASKRKSVNISGSSPTMIQGLGQHFNSAVGGAPAGAGAKSMPASRRGSSGSSNGPANGMSGGQLNGFTSNGDDLVKGLAQLQIGGFGGEALTRGSTVPGTVGSFGPNSSADSAYLWDEGLDREMQNSLRHLPPTTAIEEAQAASQRHYLQKLNSVSASSDPFATRKSSVASVALDLAAPHQQTSTRSYLLSHNPALALHTPQPGDWPSFKSTGGLGSMTAGNGTPVLGGTPILGGSRTLGGAAEGSPNAVGRIPTPNGSAALNPNRLSVGSVSIGLGLGPNFSPVEGSRGGSPGGLMSADGYMNNARSVPATPMTNLPSSGNGMHKGNVDVVPSPYPEFSNYPATAQRTPAENSYDVAYGTVAAAEDAGVYGAEYSSPYMGGFQAPGSTAYLRNALGDAVNGTGSRPGTAGSGMLGAPGRFVSGRVSSVGSDSGIGPKMGGLHGPKHKRSDLDREYNRFNGTHLEDLQGEIATMCKDQHGCRYLQKKLEEGVPEHRDMIFRETFPHFAELMIDPFGNYLCQKLLEYSTDEQRNSICQSVAQDLVTISLNMHGTRAVQKMIDFLSTSRQTDQRYDAQIHSIIVALSMHVVTLIKDLNGNHVVQKCLNKLSPEDNQFIYNAVAAHCVEVATHRHGCCVLQRCVDHASDAQRVQLVTEITYNALTLVQDPYGNYVVQYILDLNDNRFSDAVIRQFLGNVCALSVQKFSSNVIEKCIRVAEHTTRKMLIEELLNRNRLEKLLRDSFGNYCVQTALDYAEPNQRAVLVEYIRPILPLIRNTPYGKRIQSKLQREQMEQSHVSHYGGMTGYHNQAALVNAALASNVLNGAGQGRHMHGQSLHHASQLVDPYVNQPSLYSHTLPHGQSHLHGVSAQHGLDAAYGSHPLLQRNGGANMSNGAFGSVPTYQTPISTGFNVNLPLAGGLPEHYGRSSYGGYGL